MLPLASSLIEAEDSSMCAAVEELTRILETNLNFEIAKDKNKVRCKLTGHEMPCTVSAVESYMKGKKYKRLKEKSEYSHEYQEHLLKSSKRHHEHQLFCKLTLRHVNDRPIEIKRHIDGRRFQKALKRCMLCEREKIPSFYSGQECKERGEIFKPRQRQRKTSTDSEVDEKQKEFKDDLSDLIPGEREEICKVLHALYLDAPEIVSSDVSSDCASEDEQFETEISKDTVDKPVQKRKLQNADSKRSWKKRKTTYTKAKKIS